MGAAAAAINLQTPRLIVDKNAGAIYASNGSGNLTLVASALAGGGELSAGNLTLASSLNVGTSPLTLNTAALSLGNFTTTAGALVINNSGTVSGSGIIRADTLTFRGGGSIGSAIGNNTVIQTQTDTLTFAKTGGDSYLSNVGPLSVSGSATNASANLRTSGAVSVAANLNVGSGTVRILGAGGVTQVSGSVITAGALAVSNTGSGNIILEGANAVPLIAAQNAFDGGAVSIRSELAAGVTVGNVAGAGPSFTSLNGITTGTNSGGNISVANPAGNLTVDQPVRITGTGNGTVNIQGATTINANVTARANTTVTIAGLERDDVIINAPLVTGNATITANRDIIVNAPVTVTSTGGLTMAADADNNGTGGVLVTGAGSVTANSLTAALDIRGSSVVNLANIGGAGLGVGSLFYLQAGGTITTVQPVTVVAQPSAPATAGIVVRGSGSQSAITTSGGGITFSAPASGSVMLAGGGLTTPLLSATGSVALGARPIVLEGDARINASATMFGGLVNGAYSLALSNAATFGGAVGGATPLTALQVGGAATINADITTTGDQTFLGAVTGSGRLAAAGITFGGAGAVGASGAGNAIAINTPSLTLSKTSGAVFANNGGNALNLAASGLPLGGEITAGDVTLATSINAGASAVTLNTARLTLGTNTITSGTITVNNTGLLSSAVPLQPDARPYSLIADNLILQNSGGVFDRMPADGPGPEIAFLVQTGNLTLAKTGTALTYIGNNRAGGLTVDGTAGGDVIINSGGIGAIPDQPLVTGALTLTGANSRLTLRGAAISLGAGLTSPRLLVQNSGALASAGIIASSSEVSLEGVGSVGSATSAIALQSPRLNVNKSAGAVYASNGTGDLTLIGSTMLGGGAITAGNLTLGSALNAGTSPLTLNSARLAVGNFPTTAGALAINHSGEMTGNGIVSAETLTFRGGGSIGGASDTGTVVRTQTGTLTFAKTGGASFLVNTGSVAVSGSVTGGDINLRASGPVVVGSSLSAGSGIVRLAGTGGVSQTTGSVITAGALSASNSGSGHIVLNGSNAVGLLAATNTFDTGTVALRADLPEGLTVGSVAESGPVFPAVNGVTTGTNAGGNITVNNPIGNLAIAQPVRVTGSGNGSVNILGATTVNAAVNAAAGTTVSLAGRIEPGPDVSSDTIINVSLTTGNVTITAARDVIVNAPVTVTSVGGLSVVADGDNNGTGGVLVTGAGSLVANSLTAPLNIRGSSIANVANIGGAGLGVGSLFYIQAGGTITTVQPVGVAAQGSAPAAAGIVVHGNGSRPAIATSGGGIAFTAASGGSVVLDGGGLTSALLSATGVVTLGARPIALQGDTRIVAASTIFGGATNGANGLSVSNAATFEAAVGGNTPLASLEVAGPATINANVTTSGPQVFSGAVSGPGRLSTAGALTFAGSGAVGAAGEGNAVNISAPTLVLNKTAGAVFVSTGGAALEVAGTALPAGGSIAAGNLLLTTAFNAGGSTVALTAAGTLGVGSNVITGGNVTLTHADALTGNGVINASTQLALNGDGAVGAAGAGGAINANTPALTVNKGAGSVFLSNGNAALSLTPTLMSGGGAITAGSVTLAAPLNAGTSALSIGSNSALALGANGITAGTLTLSHAGALTGGGSITASNLILRGGGNIGDAVGAIRLQTASVVFDKSGGASFVTNTGPLAISGVTANGDLNVAATGGLSVAGNLQVGQGTLRLVAGGGITQAAGSVITAGTLGLRNTGAGNVTLTGANAIGQFAAENAAANGTLSLRSDVAAGSVIGSVAAAGAAFPGVTGVTTRAGNLTVTNTAGGITVNQASQSIGSGTGTVVVSGATLNAAVAAAGGTDVTITGNSTIVVDTVINSPITSGNATISATRDVIVNSTLTATSTGGLALTADSDNSGSGGVLITSAGSVLANSLTQPLAITGSSIVNGQGVGGPGLGVGNVFYIQSGGTIRTVQPVAIASHSNAPAAAGIGLHGSGSSPAISTTGGGITLAAPPSATITLNGGSLSDALLTATGPITFGARPVTLAGHTRLSAPSISVGGALNGAFGFSVGGSATFGGAVGGAAPLGSLVIDGPASFSANVTTVGAQTYSGAASLNADIVFATTNNNVTFGSTVNSATATARNLTVNAGSGAITANGAIGGTNALNAVTLNSIAVTTLSAVTAGTLVTDAGGGSVLGGAVSAGTVTINDQLIVRGSGVATTGNQTYAESLQVGANARFVSSGGNINFRGTVLPDSQAANRQFEATAPNGIVAAAADIGADANRFGSVLVNGRNSRVSNVFSTGALQLAMGTGSSDVLEIMGTRISSTSGTVTLGSVPPKAAAPMRASINKGNAGNLAIDGNQVVFQPYERTSINGGDLSLIGRTSATLGTTSVSGRLMVTTPSLAIYRRGPAAVDLGNSVGMDNGIDIVASSVDFAIARDPVTGVATTPLVGVPSLSAFSTIPLGAPADGRISIATLNAPVNSPDGQSLRYFDLRGAGFSGTTIESARFGPSTPLLSLVAAGSAAATARQAVADVLPPALGNAIIRVDTDSIRDEEEPDGPIVPIEKLSPPLVDVELSAALREQLQNLGIFARPLSAEERVARLRSVPFYDQVPRKPDVRDRDYEVVDARVSKESAVAAVNEWQRQFIDPATGQSRVPAIAAALGNALETYRAASPAADAAGFRRWLESNPGDASAATALGFVREVGLLFRRIELLGLTGSEVEVSKAQILSRVLQDAPSMRAGFLRRTIEAGAPAASASAAPAASGVTTEQGRPSRPRAGTSD